MTNLQKDVLEVVEALGYLHHKPDRSAGQFLQLLEAVTVGKKYVLDTRRSIYTVLKCEPTVFQRLLPFLEITPRQGEGLAKVHCDSVRVVQLQKAWRMLY